MPNNTNGDTPSSVKDLAAEDDVSTVGYEVARQTRSLFEGTVEKSEQLLDRLSQLIENRDQAAVLRWYETRMPGIMMFIDSEDDRQEFVDGVFAAVADGNTEV